MTTAAPPEVAPVRAGEELDWAALEGFLRDAVEDLPVDGMEVLQFPNGAANLTYLVRFGDRRLVVRRPPFGRLAPGAHDMGREHRALSKLWRGYDRAPRSFAFCDDHNVIGADFLVTDYRPGVVIWSTIPPSMAHHPAVGHRAGLAVVDALAELHAVDPAGVGLVDLGRPDGFVDRQLEGWTKRWLLVERPDAPEAMRTLSERLVASRPASRGGAILHNDFKLDNTQFEPGDPDRVRSVFDWDQVTLGDPLVDLGILLNYWPDPSDPPELAPVLNAGVTELGLPTRNEVVERYAARTGADLDQIRWYAAFAAWKTAVVIQQLYVRWLDGNSADHRMGERGAGRVARQAARADAILDGEVG
jgi:aminoglycoside phosphotransferase (APT) family kinase protein